MRFGQLYDLAENWTSVNTLLGPGEIGIESDTGRFKVGNGVTPWNSLLYTVIPERPWVFLNQVPPAVLEAGRKYMCDTTTTAFAVTLPPAPFELDKIVISDYAGTFGINNLTVNRNGQNVMSLAENIALNVSNATVTFEFINTTKGWLVS
jgi:hypothetical protein